MGYHGVGDLVLARGRVTPCFDGSLHFLDSEGYVCFRKCVGSIRDEPKSVWS